MATLQTSNGRRLNFFTYLCNKYIYSNIDEIQKIILYENILGTPRKTYNTLHYAFSSLCVTFLNVSLVDYANSSNHDQDFI